jgi:hypothetical protein
VLAELLVRGVEDYVSPYLEPALSVGRLTATCCPTPQIHSHFRLLRGPIFRRFFRDQSTRWWGWCDTDVVLGHYGRLIPWAEMRDFDVVQPTHSTPAQDILLYMRCAKRRRIIYRLKARADA